MPITVSHPAVVLPFVRLCKRHGAVSALIIGSMVPDLSYFVPWPWSGYGSHSFMGLVTFSLPVGLIAVASFEFVLRKPLLFLLPSEVRNRAVRSWRPQLAMTPLGGIAVVLALMGAALTHIVWDAVGSRQSAVFGQLSWTQLHLFTVSGYRVHLYTLIQHLGTLAGGGAMAWAMRRWLLRHPARDGTSLGEGDQRFRTVWLAAILAISAVAWVYGGVRHELPEEKLRAFRYFLHRGVVWSVRCGGLAVCIYVATWWVRYRSESAHWGSTAASAQPQRADSTRLSKRV